MFDYSSLLSGSEISHSASVHPTALVSEKAVIEDDVIIGPHAIIGSGVKLSSGVKVGAGAIVSGQTSIGANTRIYPYATVGSDPQDLKYDGEETKLIVGESNTIREYANISCGTVGGGNETVIGDRNLVMAYTHIGHDCIIGNDCIFANGVQIAGHVHIGDHVVFGGMSGGHQFCRFGDRVMVAAGAIVVQDVPPFCMVQGDRARVNGLNMVGLRRSGLSRDEISSIKSMFKLLYNENLTVDDAIERITAELADGPSRSVFLRFLGKSKRGVCR